MKNLMSSFKRKARNMKCVLCPDIIRAFFLGKRFAPLAQISDNLNELTFSKVCNSKNSLLK